MAAALERADAGRVPAKCEERGVRTGVRMRIQLSPLGLTVVDSAGNIAGRVEDTYPFDGCEYEFAVVRLGGRFGECRLVPLQGAVRYDDTLQVPYAFAEMEAAPSTERARFARDQADEARAYWTASV
jgi:hypothetical protein